MCVQRVLVASGGRHVVVLHGDNDLVLHGESGGVPYVREALVGDQLGRGPREPDGSQVCTHRERLHAAILQRAPFMRLLDLRFRSLTCF